MITKIKKIVFPEDSSSIIRKILEHHEIRETSREIWEKIKKGEKTKRGEIAKITKRFAEKKISEKEFIFCIQKILDISLDRAKKINQEIQKKALSLIQKIPYQDKKKERIIISVSKEQLQKENTASLESKQDKIKKTDIYREIIE